MKCKSQLNIFKLWGIKKLDGRTLPGQDNQVQDLSNASPEIWSNASRQNDYDDAVSWEALPKYDGEGTDSDDTLKSADVPMEVDKEDDGFDVAV